MDLKIRKEHLIFLLQSLIISFLYCASGSIGLKLDAIHGIAALVWFPTGISISAVILLGPKIIPVIWLSAGIVNYYAGGGWGGAILAATGNAIEAWLASYILLNILKIDRGLRRLKDILSLATVALPAANIVSSLVGVSSMSLFSNLKIGELSHAVSSWWLANFMGSLMIIPLVLSFAYLPRDFRALFKRKIEISSLIISTLIVSHTLFNSRFYFPFGILPFPYLAFPVVLWSAIRFDLRITSIVNLLLSTGAITATALGYSNFVDHSLRAGLFKTQLFFLVATVCSLVVSAVISERRAAIRRVAEMRDELQRKFTSRTAELIETEKAFREQFLLNGAILKNLGEGVVACNLRGEFLVFNPAAEEIIGMGSESVPIYDWPTYYGLYAADRKRLLAVHELPLYRALQGESVTFEMFVRNHRVPQGVFISITANPLRNESGVLIGGIAVFADITAKKIAEEDLKSINQSLEEKVAERTEALNRSNQDLERFAYAASHDLKEPLRSITCFGNLLTEESSIHLTESSQMYLQHMIEGAARMRRLIDGLLEYSKVCQKSSRLKREWIQLETIVDIARQNLNAAFLETGAKLEYGKLPLVFVDPLLMSYIFQNLFSNSIKFKGERSPVITVDAKMEANECEVRVSDNGIGIEAQHLNRIFRVFERLHTKDEYPGSGIGLSICKNIVERHNGVIQAESTFGEGAVFIFRIPVPPVSELMLKRIAKKNWQTNSCDTSTTVQ